MTEKEDAYKSAVKLRNKIDLNLMKKVSGSFKQLLYWMQHSEVSFYGLLPIRVIIPLKYKSNISFLNYLNYYYHQNDKTQQSRNEIFDCHKPFLVNLIKNNKNTYNKYIKAEN